MEHKSLLVYGRIPSHTVCPFASQCPLKKSEACKHLGEEHEVEFSCAAARLYDTVEKYRLK